MKYREGFVSNSSSTSFCIIGKYFDKNELSLNDKIPKSKYGEKDFGILDSHRDQCEDQICLGIEAYKWAEMNVKYSDLVELIKNKFDEFGLSHDGICVNTEGWYDG